MENKDNVKIAELEARVDYLENIIAIMPGHLYWLDRNNVYQGCNDLQAKAAHLSSRQDIVGKTNRDMIWKNQAAALDAINIRIMETGESYAVEEYAVMPNGPGTYLSQKTPIRNPQGEVIGVLGISMDITERKKIEESVLTAKTAAEIANNAKVEHLKIMQCEKSNLESYLSYIINNLPHFIFWKNIHSTFIGCNQKFSELCGLPTHEIIGKTDHQMPWANHQANAYVADDKVILETGIAKLGYEEKQRHRDGTEKIMLVSKVPMFDENKKITGILCIYTDITERKKYEENLRIAKEKAEAASKAKTEFLENMRHDIRTPLTGIVGFSNILKEDASDPKTREYADNLLASSHALLEFLNDILEAIRVTSSEVPLLKKKFNLPEKLTGIVKLNQSLAAQKKLQLSIEHDATVPAYLIGDSRRIQRIILELVTNALKFTAQGAVKIATQLIKKTERDVIIKISVSDTGIGIPLDKQEEIFTRFKRLHPAYEGIYKGAGLGLTVIKQFIDDLEGEIYVESKPNAGSVFSCIFALKQSLTDDDFGIEASDEISASEPLARPARSAKETVASTTALSRILLIEDNDIAALVAQNILEKLDCQIDIASDGKTALQMIGAYAYDLVFMDIGLPGANGYEVTRQIRLQEADKEYCLPIIALTAHADVESRQQCIEAGMNATLTKPLAANVAQDVLNNFIPARKNRRKLSAAR
jgi:PAS domain S-box-containing protein